VIKGCAGFKTNLAGQKGKIVLKYCLYLIICAVLFEIVLEIREGVIVMYKKLSFILLLPSLFLAHQAYGQKPVIEVKLFEYTWSNGADNRGLILLKDSAKLLVRNSFAKAFKARWNLNLPDVALTAKPLPNFAERPRFKTHLKDKQPGKWYLFLQVYENVVAPASSEREDAASTSIDLKCFMVCSDNDSIIMDKSLRVKIRKDPYPPDQVPLRRLVAYPGSFVKGFDSIATWLFSPDSAREKTLSLKPACLYQNPYPVNKPMGKLLFNYDISGIHQLTEPEFTILFSEANIKKTGIKRNVGGRFVSKLFVSLTGLNGSKTKSYKYTADYLFKDADSTYHCFIGYMEDESADIERVKNWNGSHSLSSGDYAFTARYTDPYFLNSVTLGTDTIARFRIVNKPATLCGQMWDGIDSTTIIHLPPEWNNKIPEHDIGITGKIGSNTFNMKTFKGMLVKEFYINGERVAIFYGKDQPVSALLFRPLTMRQSKLFTLLSALPYSYLNGTQN